MSEELQQAAIPEQVADTPVPAPVDTTAQTDEEAKALLSGFQMPFAK